MATPSAVGPATDIYSLGTTLYRMLAGEGPFGASSSVQFLVAHVTEAPRDLAGRVPGVPPALAALVMTCLRKAPAERPDALTLQRRLAELADQDGVPRLHDLAARWLDETPAAAVASSPSHPPLDSSPSHHRLIGGGPASDATRTSTVVPVTKPSERSG